MISNRSFEMIQSDFREPYTPIFHVVMMAVFASVHQFDKWR